MNRNTWAFVIKIFWAVLAAGLGALCLSAVNYKKNMPLRGISVQIEGPGKNTCFMRPADIERQMLKVIGPLANHNVGDVSCDVLEQDLSRNPFVENVDVFVSGNAKLTARITERTPVMRVITDSESFYLDSKGARMPVSSFYTARVHVLTGPMAANHAGDVLQLTELLRDDEFMNAFIDQLHYVSKHEIMLIPKVGGARISFGGPDRIQEKFDFIKAFYSEVVAETGWEKYSIIDVRFRNQIICKKIPTS
jgi:cell division protein FtsQ